MSGTHGLAVWVCRYGTCGGSADSLAPCEDERRKVVELSTDDTPVTRVSHHLHSNQSPLPSSSSLSKNSLIHLCHRIIFPVLGSYCLWLSGAPLLLSVAFRCSSLTVRGFPVLRSCCLWLSGAPSYCLWLSGAPLLLSVAFRCSALAVCGFPVLPLTVCGFRCSPLTVCGFPALRTYCLAFPMLRFYCLWLPRVPLLLGLCDLSV